MFSKITNEIYHNMDDDDYGHFYVLDENDSILEFINEKHLANLEIKKNHYDYRRLSYSFDDIDIETPYNKNEFRNIRYVYFERGLYALTIILAFIAFAKFG